MKIEKYNESYAGNKIIKQYKNSLIFDYQSDIQESKKRIEIKKNKILQLINEYLNMNIEYFKNNYNLYRMVKDFEFYIDQETNKPEITLFTSSYKSDFIKLKYKDIENLLTFIDNPDFYRNTNKYNI